MKPEQARQILTEAADYISEWKSKLMVVSGNGIDIKDSSAGQFVSMGGPPGEPPLEPTSYIVVLWAKIEVRTEVKFSVDENVAPFGEDYTVEYSSDGEVSLAGIEFLEVGQYGDGGYDRSAKDAYNNPDARYQPTNPEAKPGYTALVYPGATEVLPNDFGYSTLGAAYYPAYFSNINGDFHNPELKNYVTIKFYVRGYEGESREFSRGLNVGKYSLVIRQLGEVKGPEYSFDAYIDEDGNEVPAGMTYSSLETSESRRITVGYSGTVASFYPQSAEPLFGTNGEIELVAYRKV